MKQWLALFSLLVVPLANAQTNGFSVAAQAVLDHEFSQPRLSYLLLDANGSVLAARWPEGVETPVAPGSLVKPWLAAAYGEQNGDHFPTFECQGTSGRCWLPRGHGLIGLQQAIANSCNAYFLSLAAQVDRERLHFTLAHYQLHGPDQQARDADLMGLGGGWKESPLVLARAYLSLTGERNQLVQGAILQGMQVAASTGTAHAIGDVIGKDVAFAKTGTASCAHQHTAAGDGFALVIYPAAQPRMVLLVRVHGTTGASTAKVAAAMLKALGTGGQR